MTAFRMTKKLPAITTQPYGVFVSEQKERGRYLIYLVKLTKVDFKEGDRLSENGLTTCTKHVSKWGIEQKDRIDQAVDHIVSEWHKANQAQNEAKA